MTKVTEQRIALTMSSDQVTRLDEWRRAQPDLPPRAEAIRRMVEVVLYARERSTETATLS